MTHPVLARLEARLRETRRRSLRAVALRAALDSLSLQLFLLPLAGILAAAHPYDARALQLVLATWLLYLWVPFRLERARRRGRFDLQVLATGLDRLNPEAPDLFRTVLSRDRHSAATLQALDAFYAPWENRVRDLPAPWLTKRRSVILGAAAVFAWILPIAAARAVPALRDGGTGEVYTRMLFPLRAWRAIPEPRLIPADLPETVMRGDSLIVTVKTEHVPASRPVYAHFLAGDGADHDHGGETRYAMTRLDAGAVRYAFGPAERDFSLRFSTAGFATRVYPVRVAEPPRLAALGVIVTPPAYARLPVERLPEMPALLTLLPGSRVAWAARAAAPLGRLSAEYRAGPSTARLAVRGGDREFSFEHRVTRAGELRLRLFDARGAEAAEGPFRIEMKLDAPPEITLLTPSADQDLGRALKLPVLFRARDDYGLSRVLLHYAPERGGERADERTENQQGKASRGGNVDVTAWLSARDGGGGGVWDAAGLRLEAGDAVEIWLEAFDNDAVAGPKSSLSARVKLRLPSREEVRAAVEAAERDAAVSLASALEREKRSRREEARPDKGASSEKSQAIPATVPDWEIRRVLSDQPRQHLQELRRQLDAEAKLAEKGSREAKTAGDRKKIQEAERSLKALREIRKEAQAQEKRLPPPEIAGAPLEAQRKALEALNADQKSLDKKLNEKPAEASLAPNRKQLEESLQRNLQEQKDMKAWLGERERNAASDQKRASQSARNSAQMEQDMKRALDQIDKAMEKGLENGTLSPEVLEKMERIRELLEEVLDPDEKESLRQSARDESVDARDLQKAMRDLLDKKEGLRQNLERAIRMLEALRETRALREAASGMREMAEEQKDVAADISTRESASALAERQQELNRRMDEARKELESLSKSAAMKEALKDLNTPEAREKRADTRAKMQRAADNLKAPSPDRKAAKQAAEQAAKQMKQMAAEMDKKAAQMDKAANTAEIQATLEETLDFSGWLEAARDPIGGEARRWGGEEGMRQGALRIARWLRGRLEKLADADPFAGDVLRREAAAIGAATDPATLRDPVVRAARELFKMLDNDDQGGGEQEGDGEGDSEAGGGGGGESGEESLSGRIKGASGKQSAVNRATQELLRSFLEGRQGSSQGESDGKSGGEASGGQSPGGKTPGAMGSRPGSQGEPGNGQGQGQANGPGSSAASGSGNGTANGAANAQQQVGESLEQMAESAGDAGGAARKLRQLAEEARELEDALRRRSLSPGEIERRQERFRTRLLEAANALEERGQERERRAEAYKGAALPLREPAGALSEEARIRELKRRREEARRLPLSPGQKRRVEWYYEQLLAP